MEGYRVFSVKVLRSGKYVCRGLFYKCPYLNYKKFSTFSVISMVIMYFYSVDEDLLDPFSLHSFLSPTIPLPHPFFPTR